MRTRLSATGYRKFFIQYWAVCPQGKTDPIQLKFRDILIYSIRREALHQALCVSLKINYSADRRTEHGNVWHLGEYSGTEVYLTYETSTLTDTISSIYLSQQTPFMLMVPTAKNITPEIQQFMAKNSSILFSIEAELSLQPDGSFKPVRNIPECMKSADRSFFIPRLREGHREHREIQFLSTNSTNWH